MTVVATPPAPKLELPPLKLGPITVDTPVILAPMAGITNSAFRRLCREYGGGLYVAEMVTSRALVERTPESLRIISHDDDEKVRSVQLYGVDPVTVGQAVRMLVEEDRADHIDLNFGCPVPKVTRRGGGSALPWKIDLFTSIVQTAVKEASKGNIPLTIKMRKGIDEDHLTYLDAGRIARDSGVAAVALHGRTAAQFYSGQADWSAIARLREALPDIPVLGNGDIWSAEDAVRMVRETGVDGVVVGRGCQGRPWLFGDLQAAFEGSDQRYRPGLRQVAESVYRHAELMVETFGRRGQGAARNPQAHGLVLQGLRRRQRTAGQTGHRPHPRGAARNCWTSWTSTRRIPASTPRAPRPRRFPKKPALPKDWLLNRPLDDGPDRATSPPPNWTCPVAENPDHRARRWTPGYDRPRLRPLGRGAAQEHVPLGLRAGPRPGAALLGAAPARRQDPGGGPGHRRLRPHPADAHARGGAGGPGDSASALGCDPDVVDTACLGHDLGHPPFGHNGEAALDEVAHAIGGFEGNAQTLRLLTRLEPKVLAADGRPAGLNLTRASLDAAAKYPWSALNAPGHPRAARPASSASTRTTCPIFDWLREGAPERRSCLEAQVMDLADDISYSVHDVEDAIVGRALPARADGQPGPPRPRGRLRQAVVPAAQRPAPRSTPRWPGWRPPASGCARPTAAASRMAALKDMTSQLIGRFCQSALEATRDGLRPGDR